MTTEEKAKAFDYILNHAPINIGDIETTKEVMRKGHKGDVLFHHVSSVLRCSYTHAVVMVALTPNY